MLARLLLLLSLLILSLLLLLLLLLLSSLLLIYFFLFFFCSVDLRIVRIIITIVHYLGLTLRMDSIITIRPL